MHFLDAGPISTCNYKIIPLPSLGMAVPYSSISIGSRKGEPQIERKLLFITLVKKTSKLHT